MQEKTLGPGKAKSWQQKIRTALGEQVETGMGMVGLCGVDRVLEAQDCTLCTRRRRTGEWRDQRAEPRRWRSVRGGADGSQLLIYVTGYGKHRHA